MGLLTSRVSKCPSYVLSALLGGGGLSIVPREGDLKCGFRKREREEG